MGTAAASAGAAGPSEGLRAGRSSGWTKPESTAASGPRDYGSRERADDRDSEPDYLLRATGHGPGGTLRDYIAVLFNVRQSAHRAQDDIRLNPLNDNFAIS